jgi:hypothetical protein
MPSNGFTGSVPSRISALTALEALYVPHMPRPPLAAICYRLCMAGVRMRMHLLCIHASLDARAFRGRPISVGCLIRSLGNNPFAAATFPAGITVLTRLESLYARAVRAAQCVLGG